MSHIKQIVEIVDKGGQGCNQEDIELSFQSKGFNECNLSSQEIIHHNESIAFEN